MTIDVTGILKARLEKLNLIKKDKKLYESCKVHYAQTRQGCVDFINDWGMTQDPRLDVPNIPFILFPKQIEFIEWLYDHYINQESGLIEKTRDVGATWLCCAFASWLFIFHINRTVGFGSRKEDLVDKRGDPKCIFEKLRFFIEQLPVIFKPESFEDKNMTLINKSNGSTISGETGDNIGRGGRTSMYFVDEAAFLERADRIDAALSMNTNVKIYLSTPNGNGNVFYRKRFSRTIDVFTFNWRDDPRKDQRWYDQKCIEEDPVVVAQEIDIDYDASVENSLVSAVDVDRAMRVDPDLVDDAGAPVIIGVDPARFGNDRTSIACRQGRLLHFVESFQNKSNVEVAGIVAKLIRDLPRRVRAVNIDEGGLGAGVVDILNEEFDYIYGVQFGSKSGTLEAYNKRSEIWLAMKEWFQDFTVSIPNRPELKTDLCSLQYKFNALGQYVLEDKAAAKKRGVKSPDEADAVALTFSRYVAIERHTTPEKTTRSSVTGY